MLPPAAVSLDEAHAAIELWEHYKRRTLDPTQRLAVEVMMATGAAGLWAAQTTGREMSRQNGKGDEIEVVELWGLVQRSERILHTVHDAVLLATETQSRLLSVIEGHADLRRLIGRVWRGTGQQMVEMRNGGIIWYRTRTGGGARGVDEVDRIVVDEAQHAEEEHLAAVTPTQLASVNPQLNAMGTAGIAGKSKWWWRQRRRALGSSPGGFGYVGHTAEAVSLDANGKLVRSEVDVFDRDNWRRANPALVSGRVGESFFEEQLARLGPALFAREHLGVWDPEPEELADDLPVSLEDWGARSVKDPSSVPGRLVGRRVIGVGVSLAGRSASLGSVGRLDDGRAFAQALEVAPGASWVAESLSAHLTAAGGRVAAVAMPGSGPALSILPEVERVCKAHRVDLELLAGKRYSSACESFVRSVSDDLVCHAGQVWLSTAIGGARKLERPTSWEWDLEAATADVSPLVAITVALRVLDELPAPQEGAVVHSF